jgi:hypothetical protein
MSWRSGHLYLVTVVAWCCAAPLWLLAAPGLSVSGDGQLLRKGIPYRGVGVNYFDCFVRVLKDPGDNSYDRGFEALAGYGIPFARFSATGYWPVEMHLYKTNRAEYFHRMDRVVRSAERHGVGLIPSLFWHYACVPDLVGEPMDQWGNRRSKTHAFMREYTRNIIERYRDSVAIWAWEFGNEFNLACDLPNASQHWPPVHPQLGTASERSARDELTYAHLEIALREFGRAVRKHDPHRAICDGNSILREHAWHNLRERSWKPDSQAQFEEMLRKVSPGPINLVSIHLYGESWSRLSANVRAANHLNRPLFIGEFQVDNLDSPGARTNLQQRLRQFEELRIPLAALWVFDFPAQEKDYNVSPDNSRAWQLEELGKWNSRLRSSPAQQDPARPHRF